METLVAGFSVSEVFIGVLTSLALIVAWAIKRTLQGIDDNLTHLNAVLLNHETRLSHIEGRMEADG